MSHRITVAEELRTDIALAAMRRKVVTLNATAGNISTNTGGQRWYNDTGATLTIVSTRGSLGTAPTGADAIFDVNVNGTSIWNATQANRITIVAASNTAQGGTPNTATILAGQYVTVDVDQIGSGVAGADLAVQMVVTPVLS